ncbi:hypothetical protein SAMN05518845_11019 [Variovorax sp. YR750]|nr:hypothetical protein SAMN05518845_11019 [Variovorax sp. YR750]
MRYTALGYLDLNTVLKHQPLAFGFMERPWSAHLLWMANFSGIVDCHSQLDSFRIEV